MAERRIPMGERTIPEALAPLADLYTQDGTPLYSLRTLQRWGKRPPNPILPLLKTSAGRRILMRWVQQYEGTEDTPQAA